MSIATETTYTLAQLRDWPACVPDWPSDGVALAVIGHPVTHSLSPTMHNAALAELAKAKPEFTKWRYFKFDIAHEQLVEALQFFHRKKFRGLNLTVPHKALVMEYLTSVDSDAQNSGASNTISYTKEGWKGANTDGYGLATALREDLEVELSGAHIILLGAGGAARGAAMQCVLDQCASLWIGNRTQTLRDKLVRNLRKICPSTITIQPFSLKTLRPKPPAKSVVINATSLGLKPDDGSPLDLKTFPPPAKVYDMIYRPPQTALLRQAAAMGIPNSNGLSMLVHQGAASLEIWTGETAPVAIMHQAVRRAII